MVNGLSTVLILQLRAVATPTPHPTPNDLLPTMRESVISRKHLMILELTPASTAEELVLCSPPTPE